MMLAVSTATMMMACLLISPAVGVSLRVPKNDNNCTKSGCWFSLTNKENVNGGRCGEIDAAPHMPNDIWTDAAAVENYVAKTVFVLGLATERCNHDPLAWYPMGNKSISWFKDPNRGFETFCAETCGCDPNGPPGVCPTDNPSRHTYCSLCGPVLNQNDFVQFWYPRALNQNIVQLAQSQPTLSTLTTALIDGSLTNLLSSPGPYTVFAPNNAAFDKIPSLILKNLLKPGNVNLLDKILELHVVESKVLSTDLKDGETIKTVNGDVLTVTITLGAIFISSAGTKSSRVIAADNVATNGVVHIIDTVLFPTLIPPPPSPPSPPSNENIVEVAIADPDLSTLVTALKAGDLVDTLSAAGPFTVFAPSNKAFNKLPAGVLANLLKPENVAQLVDLLTYHVVAGAAVFSKDLKDMEMVKTLEGSNVTVRVLSTGIFINNAAVSTADVNASNGVIHIINAVLIPPKPLQTIADIAVADPDLSTLVTALSAASLVDTLKGPGPFTVFAPTNEAFAALPAGVLDNLLLPANRAELVNLLTYHVVKGNVAPFFNPSMQKQSFNTVEGGILTGSCHIPGHSTREKYYYINDVRIGLKLGAISASNGVVITIDAVIKAPPLPAKTIAEIAIATPDLSTLVTAVVAADLVSLFNGTGPFTLFAPTNEAFAALPPGTLTNLLLPQNKAKLVQLLSYHAVAGTFQALDFVNGEMLKTIEGQNLTVTLAPRSVEINKAFVVTADIEATNGVVHLINGVLIPPMSK